MLILTRRAGETICIGDNVTVTVVAVHHGQVRIGIAAPKDVRVDRPEIRVLKNADEAARNARIATRHA